MKWSISNVKRWSILVENATYYPGNFLLCVIVRFSLSCRQINNQLLK